MSAVKRTWRERAVMSANDPKRTSKRSFPRALAATARSRREVGLAHRFLKLKLEPAPATIPAATEENHHYQDDDEEGGGVHVALPGASVPYGLHLFNVHWGVSP